MASPLRSLVLPGGRVGHAGASAARLTVVPARRRFAWFAMSVIVVAAGLLLGATYLHTRIAERQLEIDRLDQAFRTAQEDFDVLRAERAVLRSPTRLAEQAGELGMIPGSESEFVPIDPMLLATIIARTGQMPTLDEIVPGSYTRLDPLDQFRLVKSTGTETP